MLTTLLAYLPKMLILVVLGIAGGTGVARADTTPPPARRLEFSCDPSEFYWSG
jgi:molybdopterin biosynthesis enzyme MoaB